MNNWDSYDCLYEDNACTTISDWDILEDFGGEEEQEIIWSSSMAEIREDSWAIIWSY